MVGKLQDVVSAAVVVGAAEKVNVGSSRDSASQSTANFDTPAATVETQSRFVIDGKSITTDADNKIKADADNTAKRKQPDEADVQLKQPIDEKALDNITQELNKLMSKINANLHFNYHQEAGVMSVRLVDKETNEVIKELPPEEMVKNMVKSKIWMDAFIGTFVDESA